MAQYNCVFILFSVRSKSEDDALDAYTPSRSNTSSRRDTLSKKENTLRRDISNASQLSGGKQATLVFLLGICSFIHVNLESTLCLCFIDLFLLSFGRLYSELQRLSVLPVLNLTDSVAQNVDINNSTPKPR